MKKLVLAGALLIASGQLLANLTIRNATYSPIVVSFKSNAFCRINDTSIQPNNSVTFSSDSFCSGFDIIYPNGKKDYVNRGYPAGTDYTVNMTTSAVFSYVKNH